MPERFGVLDQERRMGSKLNSVLMVLLGAGGLFMGGCDEGAGADEPEVIAVDARVAPSDVAVPAPMDGGLTFVDARMGDEPMGGQMGASASGDLGNACTADEDCDTGRCLLELEGGYCTLGCEESEDCPGGTCWALRDLEGSVCLLSCMENDECRTDEGYICDSDDTCFPGGGGGEPGSGDVPPGGPCTADAECMGPGGQCIVGFPDGYCIMAGCGEDAPCPAGSDCFAIDDEGNTACLPTCGDSGDCRDQYGCTDPGVCLPACTADSCPEGQVCNEERGICEDPPCTADSCPEGTFCGDNGRCQIDIGSPPMGPVPDCSGVVGWACDNADGQCGRVEAFEPIEGPGYINYPLNGETANDQYRSYARRDVRLMVQHAAAAVNCLSDGWAFGNQEPLGLGDMSEANGDIPGTREGRPGHPEGTHVNGHDMDIAYYQLQAPNNYLRAVCPHTEGGQDAYHCTDVPTDFDVWRTALFLGMMHATPQLRVIGVDGRLGPLIGQAMDALCSAGFLDNGACNARSRAVTYEETDMGRGWFRFHHHHFHISLSDRRSAGLEARYSRERACLRADCLPLPPACLDPRREWMPMSVAPEKLRPVHQH